MIPLGIQINFDWWTTSSSRPLSSVTPVTTNGSGKSTPTGWYPAKSDSGTHHSWFDYVRRAYDRYSQASLLMHFTRLAAGGAVTGPMLYGAGLGFLHVMEQQERWAREGAQTKGEMEIAVNTPEYIMGSGTW